VSDDVPSPGELSRLISSIRDDQRNGFAAINQRLDKLVSADLYSAEQRRVDERIRDVAEDVTAEQEARVSAISEIKTRLDADLKFRRQVWSGIGLAVFVALLGIVLSLTQVGPPV
jgi:hypothetical protein